MVDTISLPTTSRSVNVHLLDGGSFIADASKFHAEAAAETLRMYDWCFYIHDPESGSHILWDLGLSSDMSDYPEWVVSTLLRPTDATGPRISLSTQLSHHGVEPSQIEIVLFSHAHYDHCRPIRTLFPNATGYFGPGTVEHCQDSPNPMWEPRFFDSSCANERFETLTGPWVPFGPFERAMDFFKNGSFWIIDAPGHMPGNLCAAARLEGGEWVLLGSDCCHSRALLDGKWRFAMFEDHHGNLTCLHSDQTAALDTLRRIKLAEDKLGFHVALAHDADWMVAGSDVVLMSLLNAGMKCAARNRIRQGEVP